MKANHLLFGLSVLVFLALASAAARLWDHMLSGLSPENAGATMLAVMLWAVAVTWSIAWVHDRASKL